MSDLDLGDEMMFFLGNKHKLSVKDELLLKMLSSDDDLAKFDLKYLTNKILNLNQNLVVKDTQLTSKQMKEKMILKI